MRSYLEAKSIAASLRSLLSHKSIQLSHNESLEIVAQQFGEKNWNTLSAKIKANSKRKDTSELSEGWFEFMPLQGDHFRVGHDENEAGAVFIERVSELEQSARPTHKTGHLAKDSDVRPIAGKRYLLSGLFKTKDVTRAGMFFRIDCETLYTGTFRNTIQSGDRKDLLNGTLGWSERTIELIAPDNATKCVFGFSIRGFGCVWAKDFKIIQLND